MAMASELPAQLTSIETEVQNRFKNLSTGFQKLDKIKDVSKQSKQLDELTAKMREAKRYVKSRAGANWRKQMDETDQTIKRSKKLRKTPSDLERVHVGENTFTSLYLRRLWKIPSILVQRQHQLLKARQINWDGSQMNWIPSIFQSKNPHNWSAGNRPMHYFPFVFACCQCNCCYSCQGGSFQEQEHISTTTNFRPLLTLVDIAHVVSSVGFSQPVSPVMM